MGILEAAKVVQVINRMDNTRALLDEVNQKDERFKGKLAQIIKKLEGFEKELGEIKEQLNIENLGVKDHN